MPTWLISFGAKLLPFGGWLKGNWKALALAGAAVGGFLYFEHWKSELVKTAKAEQHDTDQAQYKAAQDAANKITDHDNQTMQIVATAFGALATQRQQAIDLKVTPQIERIKDEVATDPHYRDCSVSDGVLGNLQAVRSTVDADISASNPGKH